MSFKNIGKTVYKVHDFLSWQKNKSLVLSPSFQRRPVWTSSAKSYLIDTIVKGLPIPIIFIREQTDLRSLEPIREVVDGQQRLRTLISFIEPNLLKNFDLERDGFMVLKSHNREICNLRFDKLDNDIKKRILNYEFSVHILPSSTEDSEVLQIFARMNSTGVKLNSQELRNAEYFGAFKELCYQLAYEYLNCWREWRVHSENDIARMLEVEDTSDLIITMINKKLQSKSQTTINKIYSENDVDFGFSNEVLKRFRCVMEKIQNTIGLDIINTEFNKRTLFNTLFIFYYKLLFDFVSLEEMKQPKKINGNKIKSAIKAASIRISEGNLPEELSKVLRGGTGNLESRQLRLNFLEKIYNDI